MSSNGSDPKQTKWHKRQLTAESASVVWPGGLAHTLRRFVAPSAQLAFAGASCAWLGQDESVLPQHGG